MTLVKKAFKGLLWLIAFVVAIAVMAYLNLGASTTLPGEVKTPSGMERNTAQYVTMRDGVEIAVDVWLPADYSGETALPTLIRATRYGRAYRVKFLQRVFMATGKQGRDYNYREDIRILNQEGYAIVKIDARGSGASFGERLEEWSDDEIADYGEVAEWITQQKWSNGRIGAYGVSYDGNAAEMVAVPNHPAIIAVAPQYTYFDTFQNLIRPGGVYDDWFMKRWSIATERMDKNTLCQGGGYKCWLRDRLSDGIKPVDARNGLKKRKTAYANRNNPTVLENLAGVEFRDDLASKSGHTFDDVAPYTRIDKLASSGVAMNVWVGWYDSGTIDGAISRFKTLPNKQSLRISPYTHGGKHDSNVYAPAKQKVEPNLDGQNTILAKFFDPLLKGGKPASSVKHEITYFTMGADEWNTTPVWPPVGIETNRWTLLQGGGLTPNGETLKIGMGTDTYQVDFSTTTGKRSRWQTIGGPDVIYPDRKEEDAKLLTYTSAPIEADMEISGSPQVSLQLSSTHTDGALHVYLEDVAPDGRVTYLTEGILRLSDRKLSEAPYVVEGAYHSLKREDNKPMVPNLVEDIVIPLFNTSVVVKKGHSVRVAIAGADKTTFSRVPAEGDPVLSIHHGGVKASFVELPQKWRH